MSEVEKDNRCLAFLDDAAQKWRCEDECLDEEDGMLCGTAEHFTNFAILVGGGRGSSDDPCKNGAECAAALSRDLSHRSQETSSLAVCCGTR